MLFALVLLAGALRGDAGPSDQDERPSHLWETSWPSSSGEPSVTWEDNEMGGSFAASTPSSWDGPSSSSWAPSDTAFSSSNWSYTDWSVLMNEAWDEEVSWAIQLEYWREEEVGIAEDSVVEQLETVNSAIMPDQQHSVPDWLDKVRDRRVLRGGGNRRLGCLPDAVGSLASSTSVGAYNEPSSSSSSLSAPPTSSTRSSLTSATSSCSSWPGSSMLPCSSGSSSSASPCSSLQASSASPCQSLPASSSLPCSSELGYFKGATLASDPTSSSSLGAPNLSPASSSSSGTQMEGTPSATSAGEDLDGIIIRWGVPRPGRDRWHNKDGTLKKRSPVPVPTPVLTPVPEESNDAEEEFVEETTAPFRLLEARAVEDEHLVKAVTFYGKQFEGRAGRGPLTTWNQDNSTTAGEETANESSATSSTDADSSASVGFWRHGEWVNRPRTVEEQRRHIGGRGLRRSLKREARMETYFRGEWRPKWLRDFIEQKEKRSQGRNWPSEVEPGELNTEAAPSLSSDPDAAGRMGDGEDACADPSSSSSATATWTQSGSWEPGRKQVCGNWNWETSPSPSWTPGPSIANPWADLGWWEQEEWNSWWNWVGASSSNSTWSTWSPCSTSSTTSSTTTPSFPPNHGLGPDVFPAHPLVEQTMALTNSEIATLQEAAVPQNTVHRLESMMQMLDQHQLEGRGPEARWALGCLLRRADEGAQALDSVIHVLNRRLLPRGYVPVRRVPSSETVRWHIYNWARGYSECLEFIVARHLATGLIPDNHTIPTEAPQLRPSSPPSVVASEAAASTPREAVSITEAASSPRCPSSGSGSEEQASHSLDSSRAVDSNGVVVSVETASPSDLPRGPPVPRPVNEPPGEHAVAEHTEGAEATSALPVASSECPHSWSRALNGELLGIWAEVEDGGNAAASCSLLANPGSLFYLNVIVVLRILTRVV